MRKEGKTLYLAFQESNGRGDWTDNFNFTPETFQMYTDVKAHRGLAGQYFSIRSFVKELLYSRQVDQIYVSGFSLGGAITVAAVQDIGYHIDKYNLKIKVFGIAYEPPRFFCAPNKIVAKSLKGRLLNVQNLHDPIVHLPLICTLIPFTISLKPWRIKILHPRWWLTFWKHYGKRVYIGKLWKFWPIQHRPDQVEKALGALG